MQQLTAVVKLGILIMLLLSIINLKSLMSSIVPPNPTTTGASMVIVLIDSSIFTCSPYDEYKEASIVMCSILVLQLNLRIV